MNRYTFAKFRYGILKLHVETGRYKGLPRNQCICSVCKSNDVEDELHYLFVYPACNIPRSLLYKNVVKYNGDFKVLCNIEKLKYLHEYLIQWLVTYVVDCWNLRHQQLYKTAVCK